MTLADCKSGGRVVSPVRYGYTPQKNLEKYPYTPDLTAYLEYQKARLTNSTLRGYDYTLRMLTAELRGAGYSADPRTIGVPEVNYLRNLFAQRGWKPSTEKNYLRALSAYCGYYNNHAIIKMHVLYEKNTQREVDWLTAEQLTDLISSVKDPLVVCGAVMMSYGMLRRVDAVRIKMEDIDYVHKVIKIHGKGHRGGKVRYLPLTPLIATVLKRWVQKRTKWINEYLDRYTPTDPYAYHHIPDELFIWKDEAGRIGKYTEHGGSWDNNIKKPLQKIASEKGFYVANHVLRRTGARMMYKAGMPMTELQTILGHSTQEMTMLYIGITNDDLLDSLSAYTDKVVERFGDPLHYRNTTETN